MLVKLATNIRAGAKLRLYDTHGLRRKCEEMLRLSIEELMGAPFHCLISGPQSQNAPPISPSGSTLTLPPLQNDAPSALSRALPPIRTIVYIPPPFSTPAVLEASQSNGTASDPSGSGYFLPQPRNDAPGAPSNTSPLPHTVLDNSTASFPTIPAVFEAGRSNSTASTDSSDSSASGYIPQPPSTSLLKWIRTLPSVVDYGTASFPTIPAVLEASRSDSGYIPQHPATYLRK
ncbi:MAG TPA: hypothetical protein VGO47_04845 [Chlamydiales bacterium]|nr:hypothetical protein [Chlamydiales bacterium]